MKGRIILLVIIISMLLFVAPSCSPADNSKASGLGLWRNTFCKQDGWIYYAHFPVGELWKVKSNGEERTKICGDATRVFDVCDDRIYYINEDDNNYIYSIKTDGSDKTKLMVSKYNACQRLFLTSKAGGYTPLMRTDTYTERELTVQSIYDLLINQASARALALTENGSII